MKYANLFLISRLSCLQMCFGMKKLMGLESKLLRKYVKPLIGHVLAESTEEFVMEEERSTNQQTKERATHSKKEMIGKCLDLACLIVHSWNEKLCFTSSSLYQFDIVAFE